MHVLSTHGQTARRLNGVLLDPEFRVGSPQLIEDTKRAIAEPTTRSLERWRSCAARTHTSSGPQTTR